MGTPISIMNRFTYGRINVLQVKNDYSEISSIQQQELITFAKKQIETQESVGRAITASNITGAQMIATAISQQTLAMQQALENMEYSVSLGMNQIANMITGLGQKLVMELVEIQWKLIEIQYILKNRRKFEAQELVSQGLRHYSSNQYEKAEERFLLALDFDTTDYQVLMNLGYIEIHKGNAKNAFSYFKDAFQLPDNLDDSAKAHTLWTISRLHYAQDDYDKAFLYAEESLRIEAKNPDRLYKSGLYAALSGNHVKAQERIQQAIISDATLMAKVATEVMVEPISEQIKQDIMGLLGHISEETSAEAIRLSDDVQSLLGQIKNNKGNSEYANFVAVIQQLVAAEVQKLLEPLSYSHYLPRVFNLSILKEALKKATEVIPEIDQNIERLSPLFSEKKTHEATLESLKISQTQLNEHIALYSKNSIIEDHWGCSLWGGLFNVILVGSVFYLFVRLLSLGDSLLFSPIGGYVAEVLQDIGIVWASYFIITLLLVTFVYLYDANRKREREKLSSELQILNSEISQTQQALQQITSDINTIQNSIANLSRQLVLPKVKD